MKNTLTSLLFLSILALAACATPIAARPRLGADPGANCSPGR